MRRKIVILGLIGLLASSLTSTTMRSSIISFNDNGKILYVGGSGPGNYSKIQDAINDAMPGDTIFVFDDSSPYYENIIIDKSIKLIGENKETTVINGCGNNTITINSEFVNIKEFTIENEYRYDTFGIVINGANNTISHCIIRYNSNIGISISSSNNYIFKNKFYKNWKGIDASYWGHNLIENNLFLRNKMGIEIYGTEWGDGQIVRNNIFIENSFAGLSLTDAGGNYIYNNSFFGDGIDITGKVYELYRGNLIYNNTINGKPIIYLREKSDYVISDNINAGQILLVPLYKKLCLFSIFLISYFS